MSGGDTVVLVVGTLGLIVGLVAMLANLPEYTPRGEVILTRGLGMLLVGCAWALATLATLA